MVNSLLPPNATEAENALNETMARIGDVPVPIGTIWDPQRCPESLLPWLAWSVSVDFWESGWPEQQKRDIISSTPYLHSIKGTIGAVRRAVRMIGYEVEIYENVGSPALFDVSANVTGKTVTHNEYKKIEQVVLRFKNARSHLKNVCGFTKVIGKAFFGACSISSQKTTIFPRIKTYTSVSGCVFFSGVLSINEEVSL